jgi:beta-barrel assembly-enhancing protease
LLDKVAEASPRLLEPRASRIHDFVEAGHQEQAIAAADAVLAQIPTPEAARERYTDTGEWFPWLLDHRAQASARLGKWDDALEYLRRAALLPEHGGTNVSNAINLATLYADLGRTEEAIRALGELPSAGRTTSPYGRMQVQAVRLRVALAKKDSGTAKSVLDAMRANQDDALLTFQEALLVAGKLDEAAAVLIRRLQDPKLRSSALYDVQDYQQIVPSPVMKQVEARWRVLRARKDVQEAVGRVGRIEVVPLPRSLH